MVEILVTAALILAGFIFGGRHEKKHTADLILRETHLNAKIRIRTDRGPRINRAETFLVSASVVVAADYFKTFVGSLRNIFGGNMTTHESLLQRARREAVCRAQEKALRLGARELVDLHITTTFLDQLGTEVAVYATAVR